MGSGPNLERVRTSTSCPPFNHRSWSWCNSMGRSATGFRRSIVDDGRGCDVEVDDKFDVYLAPSDERRWQTLWKKIKREICPSSSGSIRVAYDPYTYAQNFDQGLTWVEPDNLSRSFSVRFAYPSARILNQIC